MSFSQTETTACTTRCDFPSCTAKHTEYCRAPSSETRWNVRLDGICDLPEGWTVIHATADGIALCPGHAHLKDPLLLMLAVQHRMEDSPVVP